MRGLLGSALAVALLAGAAGSGVVARVGRTVPTFNGQPLPPVIDARIGGQIARLAAAVKARCSLQGGRADAQVSAT